MGIGAMENSEMVHSDVQSAANDGSVNVPFGQWQPIETAPKDGTDIILMAPGRVTIGHWTTEDECRVDVGDCGGECRCREYDYTDPSWISWDGGFTLEHPPTHWMPLPNPPSSE
jgi:hypothetical protein